MAQPRSTVVRLTNFRGGLNARESAHLIGDNELASTLNVEITSTGGVARRDGIIRHMPAPATGVNLVRLHRHTPNNSLSNTEVWAIGQGTANFYRSTTGTSWSTVSVGDAGSTAANTVTDSASFNGKLYIAYKKNAGTDRLHVWDGTSLRRAGISTPSAPTATNTGSGSYAATVRYYKVQFYYQDGASRVTYSDLGAALTFTPSGSGTGVVVTRPTAPDSASGWRVWASADNVSYYLIQAGQATGTTTFTDTTAPASYSTVFPAFVAPESGAYTPAWSAKYLLVDENRLLIAGAFETTRYASRVAWSSIQGTAAAAYGESGTIADDERFLPTNFLDLDADEGGEITGMASLNGVVYVFKRYAVYKLVRTGNADAAYRPVTTTKSVGAVSRDSIVNGEDENGSPCLYFISERGPYRLGDDGIRFIGSGVDYYWDSVTLSLASNIHGVFDFRKGRLRYWVPQGYFSSSVWDFASQFVLSVRTGVKFGAWSVQTGVSQETVSSTLLPLDLTYRNSELVPCALASSTNSGSRPCVVYAYATGAVDDDAINSSGTVTGTTAISWAFTTKALDMGFGNKASVQDVYVMRGPINQQPVTLTVTLTKDFGTENRSVSQEYTALQSRAIQQIAGLTMADAQFLSVDISGSSSKPCVVDGIGLRIKSQESL